MRSSLWRKALQNAGGIPPILNHHLHLLLHLRLRLMVLLRAHTHLASPGAPSGSHGRRLSPVPDPRPLCLCIPAVHAEVSADPDSGDPFGGLLSSSTAYQCRLELRDCSCLQTRV